MWRKEVQGFKVILSHNRVMVSLGYLRHRKNKRRKGGSEGGERRDEKERNYVLKLGGRIGFLGKPKTKTTARKTQTKP